MAIPTPISSLPFAGHTITLANNATNGQASIAPYSNTNEIILLNTSTTAGEDVYVRVADVVTHQASVGLFLLTGSAAIGDTITPTWSGGPVLTGAAARVPGANNFNANLSGLALRNDIVTALNDPANGFAATVTAVAGTPLPNAGANYYWIQVQVDVLVADGAASNGVGNLTVANVGTANFGVTPGTALTAPTQGGLGVGLAALTIDGTNSTLIPSNTAITLSIGPEGERNDLAGANGESGLALVFRLVSGTNVDVNITYVQNRGGGGA